jgi:peptidoglycan/xylan/chitin deacetylase (PgdA/CDA1 family)
MKYLREEGYKSCTLEQAVGQLHGDRPTAEKLVVITFDDGFRDFYCQAFPALIRFGFTATMFLPTSYIGEAAASFKGKDCLTWAEIRELRKVGISFGSHTVTHPQLRHLGVQAMNDEIINSKMTIEHNLGCVADSFAYPYAFPQTDADFKRRFRALLQEAGYRNGVCTTVGSPTRESDVLFLERLPMNDCDDTALFDAKLKRAYNWVSKSQYVAKALKTWVGNSFVETKPRG